MFRRLRILGGGSEIENVEDYGRVHQMFSILLPTNVRMNSVAEGWSGDNTAIAADEPTENVSAIYAQASRSVCVQLLSPFLSQGKHIPMSMMPLTLELELDELGAALRQNGGTMSWEITRPRLVASVVDLDQSLANSYAKFYWTANPSPSTREACTPSNPASPAHRPSVSRLHAASLG